VIECYTTKNRLYTAQKSQEKTSYTTACNTANTKAKQMLNTKLCICNISLVPTKQSCGTITIVTYIIKFNTILLEINLICGKMQYFIGFF